ncbi:hypothetical protein KC887_01370 [Candidatus Kaiserbacteria bacterium]|nr:hypothetical protein [Candidatus Kaiserbacteria bacterium]
MYKDIVIKKRVWIEDETDLSVWEIFEDSEEVLQVESISTVDFDGRIPLEEGVRIGEWVTDGYRLIKAEYAEIISDGNRDYSLEKVQDSISKYEIVESSLLPVAIYYAGKMVYGIEFSNGENMAVINAEWFQYIYEGKYELNLMVNKYGKGLALKRNGLVCGYIQGMDLLNPDPIWQRPYSAADMEALQSFSA